MKEENEGDIGYNSMRAHHDANMMMMESVAKDNPAVFLHYIEGELLSGKFLILPESIYDRCVELCRESGMSEDAIKNLYKSEYLRSTSK